jgi:parallel beta-helix repeat protein
VEFIEQLPDDPPGYFQSYIMLYEEHVTSSPIGISAQPAIVTIEGPPTPSSAKTIHIRQDGSVDPPTSPITRNGTLYTFTANISGAIIIERDNIILDGAALVLEGEGNDTGISLAFRSNVTIKNVQIERFNIGILVDSSNDTAIEGNNITTNNEGGVKLLNSTSSRISSNNLQNDQYGVTLDSDSSFNSISGNLLTGNSQWGIGLLHSSNNNSLIRNDIEHNGYGVWLWSSCNNNSIVENDIDANSEGGIWLWTSSNYNNLIGNNITANSWYGIGVWSSSNHNSLIENHIERNGFGIEFWDQSSNNTVYHNNFRENRDQTLIFNSTNLWDDGYPSGGNYWGDYVGFDSHSGPYQNETGNDGIIDTYYSINEKNLDRYPLIAEFSSFNTPTGPAVSVVSNSTVEDFEYFSLNRTIVMHVSNRTADQIYGFCRLTIPHSLVLPPYVITVSNNPVPYSTLSEDENTSIIYFSYPHSLQEIVIRTADTTPPTIAILYPENETYPVNSTALTFTVDEPTSWIGYSLDGLTNVTITGNITLTSLSEGSHQIVIYANDTTGNMGSSNMTSFTVDTKPPNITHVAQDPLANNVQPGNTVKVNFTVTDNSSAVTQVTLSYSANGGAWFNVSATNLHGDLFNATIPAFPKGTNVTYVVTAVDTVNNSVTTIQMGFEYRYQVIPEFPAESVFLALTALALFIMAVTQREKVGNNVRRTRVLSFSRMKRQKPCKCTYQTKIKTAQRWTSKSKSDDHACASANRCTVPQ